MMMKYRLLLPLLLMACLFACAKKPYDESADAKQVIDTAIAEAKLQKVPVVIIFGANWCPDCRALNESIEHGKKAAQLAKTFKIVKVDVGNFDKNLDIAQRYGNPIQIGIPGAAILSTENQALYVTKAGELATARNKGDEGIYDLFQKAASHHKGSH